MSVYATAACHYAFDRKAISSSTPTQLVPTKLPFAPEVGIWVKADSTNTGTIYVAKSDVAATGPGWPLLKGEEMSFDVSEVQLLYALASVNNDVLHIYVR